MRGLTVAVVSVSVRSALVLVLAAMASLSMLPVSAKEAAEEATEGQSQHRSIGLANQGNDQPNLLSASAETLSTSPVGTEVLLLSELEQPATTVTDWIAQIEASLVQITDVRVETTDAGLQVILETAEGELSVAETRTVGNALIADIENAAIAQEFSQTEPIEGIALVSVTSLPGSRVRVAITGTDAPPVSQISSDTQQLTLNVTMSTAVNAGDDESIQVIVTGEQDEGYNPLSATTATRTDTQLRDIPQSIQVIPQQVLQDQQATRLEDALRNAPGVTQSFAIPGILTNFTIRGFEVSERTGNSFLRDGLPDPTAGQIVELFNIERIEVLRGPASVLFGFGNPGGTINLVTEQPLRNPLYVIDATVGNYSFYQGAIDLSAPLNSSETVLYRLNTAYRNSGSFVDFLYSDYFSISPVISIDIGDRTNLILEGEHIENRASFASGAPATGTVRPNPNGEIRRSANFSEPSDTVNQTVNRIGYRLEHQLNDNWLLRNAFRATFRDYSDRVTLPGTLDEDNRTLNRFFREYDLEYEDYSLITNLTGRFSTGSIEHQLLFGVDLGRFSIRTPRYVDFAAASIDIFAPIYNQPLGDITTTDYRELIVTDSIGIYLQDQVSFSDELKLLLGLRFDAFEQRYNFFTNGTESSQADSAFSPRLGIVYQPIPSVALYASYSSSFTPARGTVFFGNFDREFEPGRGTQYEIGIKTDLSNQLAATLAFYDLTRTNVLVADPNNPGFSIQTGEQRSQGVEFNIAGEILPGWNIFSGYAYTDARITEDTTFRPGNRLDNTADHSFNLWTTYEIQEGNLQGLGVGLGLFFVGDRAGDLENNFNLPSYLRTDAAIFYNRGDFRAALNFRNVFDTNYFEFSGGSSRIYYGQPFTVQGTISWRF